MEFSIIEYPAMVYQGNRNKIYIASCIMKNLVGYGRSAEDAIKNLETALSEMSKDYIVKVKPVKGFKLCY